jgi:hypothetical protein
MPSVMLVWFETVFAPLSSEVQDKILSDFDLGLTKQELLPEEFDWDQLLGFLPDHYDDQIHSQFFAKGNRQNRLDRNNPRNFRKGHVHRRRCHFVKRETSRW